MFLSCFILINSVFVLSVFSHDILNYHGDTSIYDHLQTFCLNVKNFNSILILISLSTNTTKTKIKFVKNEMSRFLEQKNCSFIYYQNFESTELTFLTRKQQWRYKRLLFLFDFTTSTLSEENFVSMLILLDNFYHLCSNCLPLLSTFDLTVHQLTRFSQSILPALKRDFRIVLISNSKTDLLTGKTVVHLNPVLYGCKLEQQIFVPQSSEHFEQLKMSTEQCNLKSSTLNASFNNVFLQFFG